MKLARDADPGVNLIRGYAAGEVRVGERSIRHNCIVFADDIVTDWAPGAPADLEVAHLARIFEHEPEIVLLGTGATQRFPDADIRRAFAERGVALETMDLGAACRTFNILVQEERRVAAALFVG